MNVVVVTVVDFNGILQVKKDKIKANASFYGYHVVIASLFFNLILFQRGFCFCTDTGNFYCTIELFFFFFYIFPLATFHFSTSFFVWWTFIFHNFTLVYLKLPISVFFSHNVQCARIYIFSLFLILAFMVAFTSRSNFLMTDMMNRSKFNSWSYLNNRVCLMFTQCKLKISM